MENKKLFLNLFIVMFSIGTVFFFRMESRKTSYSLQKKYETLNFKRKSHRTLVAQLRTNSGENLYNKDKNMIAFKSPKNQQVVMVSNKRVLSTP